MHLAKSATAKGNRYLLGIELRLL